MFGNFSLCKRFLTSIVKQKLVEELAHKLPPRNTDSDTDVESEWTCICDAVYADGNTLMTSKENILERWVENFEYVLNRPSTFNDKAIARLPKYQVDNFLQDPRTE